MYRHIDTHDHNYGLIFDRDVKEEVGEGHTIGSCAQLHENHLYMNHINYEPPYFPGSTYPHILKYNVNDVDAEIERIEYKRTSGFDKRMKQFGATFGVIHDLLQHTYPEFYIMSANNNKNGVHVFDKNMEKIYSCVDDVGLVSDSSNNYNYLAFATEAGDHQRFVIITEDMIRNNSYVENCKLDKYSNILGVTNGEDYSYTLEGVNADIPESVYSNKFLLNMYDIKRGTKVGRVDIVMLGAKRKSNGQFDMQLAVGYNGVDYGDTIKYNTFASGSNYQPHAYHDEPVVVKIKAITSCNSLMPCSQFIVGEPEKVINEEQDYVDIDIHSIDHISEHVIAISYMVETHIQYEYPGLHYQIDIVDMHKDRATIKTLDIDRVLKDHKCNSKLWYDSALVFSLSHDHVQVTDNHIVVPVMMYRKKHNRDVGLLYGLNTTKTVLALFNKQTFDYISYIDIGEHNIVSNLSTDCSKIAVSLVNLINNTTSHDELATHYADMIEIIQDGINMSSEHILVFQNKEMSHSCTSRLKPICTRKEERWWETGTDNEPGDHFEPAPVFNPALIVQKPIDVGGPVHYRFVTKDKGDLVTATGRNYVNIQHRAEYIYEMEPFVTNSGEDLILQKI